MMRYLPVLVVLLLASQACAPTFGATYKRDSPMTTDKQVREILLRLTDHESLSTREVMQFGDNPDAPTTLIRTLNDLRLSTLDVMIELGRPVLPEDKPASLPRRPGQVVTDSTVVSYLVELLNDNYREMRSRACRALAELAPPSSLKPHLPDILGAVRRYPDMDRAVLLLGKTDTPEALRILNESEVLRTTDADDVIMVRARLGDQRAEQALIAAYTDTVDPQEKGALALRLGYAATPQTIRLLATEMRNPAFYCWNKQSRRSLRLHIIQGLHQAFPEEPLFWKPFFSPADDSYYGAIETWLTEHTKVTWDVPRPEFLYQEDAPTGLD